MEKFSRLQANGLLFGYIFVVIIWGLTFWLLAVPQNVPANDSLPTPLSLSNQQVSSASNASVAYVESDSSETSSELTLLENNTAYFETPPITEPITITPLEESAPDQRVITFPTEMSDVERNIYITSIGGTIIRKIDALNTVVIQLSDSQISTFSEVSEGSLVSEPNYYVVALQDTVNDPFYSQQWALPAINIPSAWSMLPINAPQIVVAVIDSGVCLDHPELVGRISDGYDFVEDDSMPQDDFGHGCGVAGIIAGSSNNGEGIAGIAQNATIMPLRVLNAQGIGQYSDVAAAIVHAVDFGAQIINLSLGGTYRSRVLESAIDYAVEHGVMVISAAGNTGGSVLYPAAYAPVIAVGSVDQNLQRSSFSSFGAEIDLYAPGRDIITTRRDGTYGTWSGTSFASPQVAGVAALELAFGRTLILGGGIVSTNALAPAATPTTPSAIPATTTPSQVSLSGWLHIWHGDPPPGSSLPPQLKVVLADASGAVLAQLQIDYATAERFNGHQVQIIGQIASPTTQNTGDQVLIVEAVESIDVSGLSADITAQLTGSQPFINVLCRFSDIATIPYPPSFYGGLFGSSYPGLDHYWRQISYDNINIVGTQVVSQWYTMPHPRSFYIKPDGSFELNLLASDCATAADTEINFPQFVGINFFFNEVLDCCAWGGSTGLTIDGQSRSYRSTWLPPWAHAHNVIAHEMGHSFGFPHSTGPSTNPPSGLNIYVSRWDVMSTSNGTCAVSDVSYGCLAPGTIVFNRDIDSWIPPTRKLTVGLNETATIILERLILPVSGTNPLMAVVPISGSSTRFYTIEARNLTGYDQNIPGAAIIIHDVDLTRSGNGGYAYVVDSDGNNNVNDAGAMWLPGETFNDSANSISVEVLSSDSSSFTVRISNNAPTTCNFTIPAGDVSALISAINSANANGTPDTICLAPSSNYVLTAVDNATDGGNGLPVVTSEITIFGSGSSIERSSGAPNFRIFNVAITGDLTINNVIISGGVGGLVTAYGVDGGGGIYSQGALTVVNSTISGNSTDDWGGGIATNSSYTTIANSVISDNTATSGGGIFDLNSGGVGTGTLGIANSTIASNSAFDGGGISHAGPGSVGITGSSLLNNTATNAGGAFYNNPSAGATIYINNSCVVRNSAPISSGIYSEFFLMNAAYVWWGSPDGPGGFAPGLGDSISDFVSYAPFLTDAILGCPTMVPNDLFADAHVISSLPFTFSQDVYGSSVSPNDPEVCFYGQSNTVWFRYTPVEAQAVHLDTFGSFYDTVLGVYTGTADALTEIVCNDDSGGLQSQVNFVVNAGTTYYIAVAQYGSFPAQASDTMLTLNANVIVPPNDEIDDATVIGATPFSTSQLSLGATVGTSPIDPAMSCVAEFRSTLWFRFTAAANGTALLNTTGSNYDTALAVYTGAPGSLTQVACNDDYSGQLTSFAAFSATSGTTYYIMVASFGATPLPNSATLNLSLDLAQSLILIAPTGTISNSYGDPDFMWMDIGGATYYYLYVTNSAGTQVINEVVSDVGYCNGATCTFNPSSLRESYRLTNGTYNVMLRAWTSSNNIGIWQGPFIFTLSAPPPAVVTFDTTTNINTLRPSLHWTLNGFALNATYFHVYLARTTAPSGVVIDQWLTRSAACSNPSGISCSYTLSSDLVDNITYQLYMQSYGPGGLSGGLIAGPTFMVDVPIPTLPSGITVNPNQGRATITWTDDANATYFNVYLRNNAGVQQYNAWHLRSAVCTNGTCSLTPPLNLANGSYQALIRAWSPGGFSTGGPNNDGFGGPIPFTFNFGVPDIATIINPAPSGATSTGSPSFTWNTVAGATFYYVWVGGAAPSFSPMAFQQWYDANAICTPHPGTCTVSNVVNLQVGNYSWRLQAWGPGGLSALYNAPNGVAFNISTHIPAPITLISPTGIINSNTPTFTWSDQANVDWYNVFVSGGTMTTHNQWYRADRGSGMLCDLGTCTLTIPNLTFANGNYQWNVRGYGAGGIGSWNTTLANFTVMVPTPNAPVPVTPDDGAIINTTNRPTFVWNTTSNAAYYNLEVRNGMGTVVFTQWYQANVGACTVANCTVQLPNPISYSGYNWAVRAWSQGGLGAFSSTRTFFSLSINAQPLMISADDGWVLRGGTWGASANEAAVGQAYLASSGSRTDTLTFTFSGTVAEVVYVTAPEYGSFMIEVDGVPVREVNAQSEQVSVGNLAAVRGLAAGEHILRVIPLEDAPIAIDGIIVDGQALVAGTAEPTPSPTIVIPTLVATDEATPEVSETVTVEPTIVPPSTPTAEPTVALTSTPTYTETIEPTVEVSETPMHVTEEVTETP